MAIWNNNQEVFDAVLKHLNEQKEKSREKESCLYRGPNGLKCAIGALIPDELYDPFMDTATYNRISSIIKENPDHMSKIFSDNISVDLLTFLQSLHDNYWYDNIYSSKTINYYININVEYYNLTVNPDLLKKDV